MQTNLSETEVSFQNTVTVAFTLSHATLRCGVYLFSSPLAPLEGLILRLWSRTFYTSNVLLHKILCGGVAREAGWSPDNDT